MQRLTSLGETRWRAKHNAAVKIFGAYDDTFDENDDSSTRLYHTLVLCLNKVSNCPNFTGQHRSEAKALQDKLLDFEVILTAFIYLRIFKHTTPLSDYLQTAGLNYVQAWRMISTVQQNLTDSVRDFEHIVQTANAFVTWANERFENLDYDDCDHIMINPVLKEQPVRRKKRMAGEIAKDDSIVNPIKRFEVTVRNVIMDGVINQFERRFSNQGTLYKSLEILDPRCFKEIGTGNIKRSQFDGVKRLLPDIDISKLQLELTQFAREWPSLKYPTQNSVDIADNATYDNQCDQDDEDCEGDGPVDHDIGKKCATDCIISCLRVIVDYNMFSSAYQNLYVVYKTVLTTPMTQVCCEQSFSQLKMIKSRSRNSLRQDNLEACMLLSLNRQWTHEIDNLDVIQKMCDNSIEFRRLLQ